MSTRLSSASRTPISERIKLFDNGVSRPAPRTPSTPTSSGSKAPPSPIASPVLKPVNAPRSQFSAKDPSNSAASGSKSAAASSVKKQAVSPTSSVASSKSDLSRTPSNASTKSSAAADQSRSSPRTRPSPTAAASSSLHNGRSSPSPKKTTPAASSAALKKTAAVTKTPSLRKKEAADTTTRQATLERRPSRNVSDNGKASSPSSTPPADKHTTQPRLTPRSAAAARDSNGTDTVDRAAIQSSAKPLDIPREKKRASIDATKNKENQEETIQVVSISHGGLEATVAATDASSRKPSVSFQELRKESVSIEEMRKISVKESVVAREEMRKVSSSSSSGSVSSAAEELRKMSSSSSISSSGSSSAAAPAIRKGSTSSVNSSLAEMGESERRKASLSIQDSMVNNSIGKPAVEGIRRVSNSTVKTNGAASEVNGAKLETVNGLSGKPEQEKNGERSYWANQAAKNPTAESVSKVDKAMKLDVESKDEKIHALQKEIIEMQGGGATEEEVRSLKKGKKDLEMQLKDQEEELDDLAAQVQMLEGSKTKLEMEMAALKKEFRRDLTSKEEEIEEARASANKKVKILEQQLEQEHEERIMFLRERHDLEQKIGTLQDMLERSGDEEQVAKLKKDLKKTKALLRDAQLLVEKNQNDGTNKVILRQLKNQLEDAEFARTAAMKARQNAELELADTQSQLDEVSRGKQDLEDRYLRTSREKAELSSQLQENEEELQDVMRKYKASVAAVSTDQITIQDQQNTIQELEDERNKLRDSVAELSSKLGNLEGENVSTSQHKRLELKIRELESKLELEITSKGRMEIQIQRLKEVIEKVNKEKEEVRLREQSSQDLAKKTNRQLRDLKEEFTTIQGKETELCQKKFDLEKQLEVAEAETLTVRSDLKLALKRIEDLQAAIQGDIDTDNSDDNSDSCDDEMHSFLEHHRRAMSVQRERESMARESVARDSIAREVRAGTTGRTFSSFDESKEMTSLDSSKNSTILEADESLA